MTVRRINVSQDGTLSNVVRALRKMFCVRTERNTGDKRLSIVNVSHCVMVRLNLIPRHHVQTNTFRLTQGRLAIYFPISSHPPKIPRKVKKDVNKLSDASIRRLTSILKIPITRQALNGL